MPPAISNATSPAASQPGVELVSVPVTGKNPSGGSAVIVGSAVLEGMMSVAVAAVVGVSLPASIDVASAPAEAAGVSSPIAPTGGSSGVTSPTSSAGVSLPVSVGVASSPVKAAGVSSPITPADAASGVLSATSSVGVSSPVIVGVSPNSVLLSSLVAPGVSSTGGVPVIPPPIPVDVSPETGVVGVTLAVGVATWGVAVWVEDASGGSVVSKVGVGVAGERVAIILISATVVGGGEDISASGRIANTPKNRRVSNTIRTRRFFFLVSSSNRFSSNTTFPVASSRGPGRSRPRR